MMVPGQQSCIETCVSKTLICVFGSRNDILHTFMCFRTHGTHSKCKSRHYIVAMLSKDFHAPKCTRKSGSCIVTRQNMVLYAFTHLVNIAHTSIGQNSGCMLVYTLPHIEKSLLRIGELYFDYRSINDD